MKNEIIKKIRSYLPSNQNLLPASILVSAIILSGAWIYVARLNISDSGDFSAKNTAQLEKIVLPEKGVILPVTWGDFGKKMISAGVIDKEKFERIYAERNGLDEESKNLLIGSDNRFLKITNKNSGIILNLLWGFGLANKNEILETGPMTDKKYGGGPGGFASTGGWTLSAGNPMDHYSRHALISLTPEQQQLVERVSKNIYRPCCGNSTHFPDCNHGMAMLGLLEIMASQGTGEDEMYRTALAVNSFWFPDTYLTIAKYLKIKGMKWEKINPKNILNENFSSASGYRQILNEVQPAIRGGGGSCGV